MGLSETIHKERYAQHGEETWSDTAMRIAKAISKAEQDDQIDKWTETFHKSMIDFDFIPGGRIISNAGKAKQYMMNCNLLDLNDSRESIGHLLKDILVVSGTGGGVGVSYSSLRPKGAPIQTSGGVSSGSISFMHCADTVAGTIKTGGGRRAALMLSLSAHHPDILDFLHEKLDLGKLNNANISVEIDQKFIDAVKNNDDWELIWAGKTQKTVKAREIWDILIKNALASGEPGIMNLGLMKELSNSEYFAPVAGTNPCQPKTSLFLTQEKGIKQLKDINIGDIIWTGKRWSSLTNKWSTGIKPVYRYTTSNGYYTECTENHRAVQDGIKVKIKDANHIDKVTCCSEFGGNNIDKDLALLAGLLQGDGSMQKNGGVSSYLNIGLHDEDHKECVKHMVTGITPKTEGHCETWKFDYSFNDLGLNYAPITERTISDFWIESDSRTMRMFLKGLYSANGSVIESAQRITLKSSNKKLIQQVQIMLSALGIRSYYTTNKSKEVVWQNGIYTSKESYDLNITSDIALFADTIGFTQQYKIDKIHEKKKTNPQKSTDIVDIECLGDMEVFDYTVEAEEHTVWQGGLHLSNCGEQPLEPFGSCCLGSVNISNFAREKYLDVKGFKQAIETAVRFLDNVISVNTFPLENIRLNSTSSRRIGLGVTGLHYAMLKLGIKYGSDEGVAFTEKAYEILRNHSYFISTQLADEKGAFPKFDRNKYLEAPFVKSLPTKIRNEIREKGIRNVCLNTQAPCGTTSILANVSSGIEPIFAPVYERRYRSHDDDGNEVTKIEIVSDELFSTWIEEGKDISHFEGSHDVGPEWHIKVQEAAQRYIDSAVSKTVNLPKGYSAEDLSELLLHYMPNLKGITVYRDGSRGDSPLVPLDPSEYKNRKKDAEDIGKGAECSTGACEI